MCTTEHFDVLIFGSGQGGKLLAWDLARIGKKVAVVEREWVGGACPAVACMPSKNEVWSARVAYLAEHAEHFGTVTGAIHVDMMKVWRRKQDMIEREITLHLNMYQESGAQLIMGIGRFIAPKMIEVLVKSGGTRVLTGDHVVVNVGSHAAVPNMPGMEVARPLTHIEALDLDRIPEHLIVLGGGYVGIEMAQAYRRFGSSVTVIEPGPQIMAREDCDVADELSCILTNGGIDILFNTNAIGVKGQSGQRVTLELLTESGEKSIEGSHLLVAVGRTPNTVGIGLETAGVEMDSRGYIRVNEQLKTSAQNVWAIGECAGSPHFTHASVDDFRTVRDNMAGKPRSTTDRIVPHVMFTDPQLAHVGLNEKEAQRRNIPVRLAKLPMRRVLRTEATEETQGFMKALVSQSDDGILGFTMIGSDAGEVMAAMQTAMLAKLPYQILRDAVLAHMTMAEAIGILLANIRPRT